MDWFTASQGRKDDRHATCDPGQSLSRQRRPGGQPRHGGSNSVRQQLGRGFFGRLLALLLASLAYYALPVEPPVAVAVVLALLAALRCAWLCLAGRSSGVAQLAAFVLAGFVWGQVSTWF
jgi:hypothetical protein